MSEMERIAETRRRAEKLAPSHCEHPRLPLETIQIRTGEINLQESLSLRHTTVSDDD